MNLLEILKQPWKDNPNEDFFRRNSGKKISAKTTMPTEEEVKQQDAEA